MPDIPPIIDTADFYRYSLERLKTLSGSTIEIPAIIDEAIYRRLTLEYLNAFPQ